MADLKSLSELLDRATQSSNDGVAARLPLEDQSDFKAAGRGKIADVPSGGIDNAHGHKAWDISDYDFLHSKCPSTVNPSLWRMAQLNASSGLFEVVDGVWQARAFDYANMTIIRGETGWVLVDPGLYNNVIHCFTVKS